MNHSPRFKLVKSYYDRGLWSIERVAQAVKHNWITKEEYFEITGQVYPEDQS